MKTYIHILFLVLLISCQSSSTEFAGLQASMGNAQSEPVVEPTPAEAPKKIVKVCKLETASNFEPRATDGDTIFEADNSLCIKEVCEEEYVQKPFEIVEPSQLAFGCESLTSDQDYELTIGWAADDSSSVYLDGELKSVTTDWRKFNEKTMKIKGGCHTLSAHVQDKFKVISGLLAYIKVDGQVVWRTGDDNKHLKVSGPETPKGDWMNLGYDDSGWKGSESCTDISPWGSSHAEVRKLGAKWIWWSAGCKDLSQAFYRLTFSIGEPIKTVVDKPSLCSSK